MKEYLRLFYHKPARWKGLTCKRVAVVATIVITLLFMIYLIMQKKMSRSIQGLYSNETPVPFYLMDKIEQVINEQRITIDAGLTGYQFPIHNGTPTDIDDFLSERGGRPLRSIIITSWRSGSTFLGEILNSVPANFYHCEPLVDHGVVKVKDPAVAMRSLKFIRQLLNCDYSNMDKYLTYLQDNNWPLTHNTRLWGKCLAYPELCFVPQFLSKFCSLFPFQSIKLVRVRLSLMEEILEDTKFGAKVLLLVRDPRGTIQSRHQRRWCRESPDCSDPERLCSDLVADHSTALKFQKKFPNTFRAVRYEDISLNPFKEAENILKFFGLQFHPFVNIYIGTHTNKNYGGVSSTYRNSSSAPFHWRSDLTYAEIKSIQEKCKAALPAWGYLEALNSSHVKTFDPVKPNFTLQ